MKKAVVATVSAFCEPWFFRRFHKPTLPANSAVGVATQARIFIRVIRAPSRALANGVATGMRLGPHGAFCARVIAHDLFACHPFVWHRGHPG